MQSDKWNEISSVLDKLLTLDESEQYTYLENHYGDDEELVKEIRNILYSISQSEEEDFLGDPEEKKRMLIKDRDFLMHGASGAGSLVGQRVGAYELEEEIGSGGMGSVYRAQRADGQFEQTVAVKFIHQYNLNDFKKSLFRQEQKILANLQHPNIGMLLDGGVSENGQPYLIMEYVDGMRIDKYCRENKPGVPERLRLFNDVLKAISYAHSNLVVHRDIKPGNILVTRSGQVKVVDFGIAKLISDETGQAGVETSTGRRQFTPYFAAPEQVLEKPTLLQTDIYALGMLMHTLFAGRSPFDFSEKSMHEVERVIVEEMPPRMSEMVQQTGEKEIRETFGMSRYEVIKSLRGDLDAIAEKATRKEPEERYSSVSVMQDDFSRYQNDQPVLARKGSLSYRSAKFLRRNRQLVAGVVLLLVSITAIVSFYTYQLNQQRMVAEREAERSHQIAQFLVGIFESANTYSRDGETLGLDASIGSILDYSIGKMDEDLADQPELNARLKTTLGGMYVRLGEFDRAEALALDALETMSALDDDSREELAIALFELSRVNHERGNAELADSLVQQSIRVFERMPDKFVNEQALVSLSFYANINWFSFGNFSLADSVHNMVIDIRLEHFPDNLRNLAASYNDLAALNHSRGYFREASESYRQAISIYQSEHENHPSTAVTMSNYSILLREYENHEEAWQYQYEALQIHLDKLGLETIDAGLAYSNLAEIAAMQGDNTLADSLITKGLGILTDIYGDVHPYIGRANLAKALILKQNKRHDEAEELYLKTKGHYEQFFPSDHPRQADPLFNLGKFYLAQDRPEEAVTMLASAFEIREELFGIDNWRTALSMSAYGKALHRTGATDEALVHLQHSTEVLRNLFGDEHPQTKRAQERLDEVLVL